MSVGSRRPSRIATTLLVFAALTTVFSRRVSAGDSVDQRPFPSPPTKKGLQVQMVDDALALGVHHAALNVDLTSLIDPMRTTGGPVWTSNGTEYGFSAQAVASLDSQVKPLSDRDVVVYLILLPYASGDALRDPIMLHPAYATGEKDTGPIAMFNTTDAAGTAWLTAAIDFLAARYTGDGEHGRVSGFIAGNEVNSHWFWANMGHATLDEVVAAYEKGVRLIHSAVRRRSANARVYISLEHCWNERYAAGDETQCVPGRAFLEAFAAACRANGDFDWHVAYHPYPEPLTDCRFWLDEERAPQSQNAKVVTFRNLEVLVDLLHEDRMRYEGKPRRVILSEQGFHCTDEPDGEQNQAAAYALAYAKVARMDGIDAFILHRHVDHAHEGGLNLGLWTNQPGSIATPDRKRPMYEVFRAAGTAEQDTAFQFALPIIGANSWDEALKHLRAK